MKKILALLLSLWSLPAIAGGLQASFESSRFEGLTRSSTVVEYRGVVDDSNNLIDFSGENLLYDRTEIDDWGENGTCTVTANSWRNPLTGAVDADYLDNTSGANTDFRYKYTSSSSTNVHTGSVWVRADYVHEVSILLYEQGVGTIATTHTSVGPVWRRVTVSGSGTGVGVVGLWLYPGRSGISTGSAYFYGTQVVENDQWRTGAGVFLNPSNQSVIKPKHDLSPTNTPVSSIDEVVCRGNKCPAEEYDGSSYHSKADQASLDVYTGAFTVTARYRWNSDGAQTDFIYAHGNFNSHGCYIYLLNTSVNCRCNGGSTSYTSTYTLDTRDDNFHTVHCVNDANQNLTVYVDGNAGNTVSSVGTVEPTQTFYVAAGNTGVNILEGRISYLRIDAEALSADRRAYERDVLNGISAGVGFDNPSWSFTRTTTAYADYNNGTLDEVAAGVPRVSNNGVLIEGPSTNLITYSKDFDAATTDWVNTRCSVTNDTDVGPDGFTEAETIHEDGTAADSHFIRYQVTTTSGEAYTYSFHVKANNRDWAALYLNTDNKGGYFNVTEGVAGNTIGGASISIQPAANGYYRCIVRWTSATTGSQYVYLYVSDANGSTQFDGLDQDSLYAWGAQLENLTFASSYIETDGSTQTRNGDDLTIDPHAADNEIILPITFCATCAASKFTLYYEVKCEYESSTDLGQTRYWIDIGNIVLPNLWNRNRIVSYVSTGGLIINLFRDDSSVLHQVSTLANPLDFSDWFSVRFFVDFSDLSRMDAWLSQPPAINESNTGMVYTANSGTATLDTTSAVIRIGQQNNGDINSFCKFRGLRIISDEVRP